MRIPKISIVCIWIGFFVHSFKGIVSSCESISVKEGDTAKVKFHFDNEFTENYLDVNILINLFNGSVISSYVGWFVDGLKIFPNYSCLNVYFIDNTSLILEIINITQTFAGNYSAFIKDSVNSEIKSCIVTVNTKTIENREEEKLSGGKIAAIVIGVIIGFIFLLAIFACIYYLKHQNKFQRILHTAVVNTGKSKLGTDMKNSCIYRK